MFGSRLRSLRKERRWTIDDVSKKLGIGRSTYAGYEKETRTPPLQKIQMLADLYEVTADYILGLSDDKEIKKVESNVYEYLKKGNLHWNGKPLNEDELKAIRDLMEIVVRDRIPNRKE